MATLWVYVAFDGDHIGREVERAGMANDIGKLKQLSQQIEAGNEVWKSWAIAQGGEVISSGGDEGNLRVTADKLVELEELRERYAKAVGAPVSVGVGAKLSEAGRALMAAKLRGGDRITLYDPSIEDELAEVEQETEAEKISHAYLQKSLGFALTKAEGQFRAAAFRHKTSGKVYETGPFHSLSPWMKRGAAALDGHRTGPHNSDEWDAGFVTHEGQFMDREAALMAIGPRSAPSEPYSEASIGLHKDEPALNKPNAGGGMTGPSEPQAAAPDAPIEEGSEHSENESLQSMLADNPPPEGGGDLHDVFGAAADAQGQQDLSDEEAQKAQEEASANQGDLKQQVLKILKTFQDRKDELEQLSEQDPELYQSMVGMVKVLIAGAKTLFGSDAGGDDQQKDEGEPTKKSEDSIADTFVDNSCKHFYGKGGKKCLKCKQSKDLDKAALEAGKTGRHNVVLPVGSQKDGAPAGSREAGKIKVQNPEDGKTKWRSVRAGQVMAQDGSPISSRNPGGK